MLAPEVEGLEPRRLLTVTPSVSGNTVTFTGSAGDDVYLQTSGAGELLWSEDGTSYSSNLGGTTFNVTAQASTIQISLGGTLHLGNALATGGQDLTIQGTYVEDVSIGGTIDTQGGDLSITQFARATVGTSAAVATVSTRNTGGNTSYATAPSQGSSGSLTLSVQNVDPFNPILNINFQYPQINVGAGSALLAQADGGHAAGDVTLTATNTNYTLDGLSFPTLEAAVRSSAVTLADGSAGQGAVIQGGNITLTATSGDIPIVSSLIANQGENTNNEFASWGQWVGGFLNGALEVVNTLPKLNAFNLPVSVDFRDAHTGVTIGQNALVRGSGDVSIQASSTADAEGTAIYSRNSQGGVAIAVMVGITDAQAEVKGSALVESTGGDVTIDATSSTTTTGMARVSQNFDPQATSPDHIQVSLAVGVIDETAHATIDQGATIRAAGGVAITASGSSTSTGMPASSSYSDGRAGGAFAINATVNDIRAQVAGTVIAGIIDDGSTATNVAPALTFNPFTDIDFATGGIRVPAADLPKYKTGQAVVYTTGGGGAVGGLTPGATYYVIAPTGASNEIRLAATLADARAGKAVTLDAYPTLSDGTRSVPITLLDETTGTISFGFDPGFADGAALTYRAVPGKLIGGLVDGTTYYAIVDPASPYTLQLSAVPKNGDTDGPVVPLNLNPVFQGARQALGVTINADSSITFGFDTGFRLGDFLVYQGGGISGLTAGVTYWVIPDANDPKTIRLAATLADAQAGQALTLGPSGGAVLTFDPAYSINSATDAIDLGFNYALAGTLPSGTPLVYHGALGTAVEGLAEGAIYYVIQDPADPRLLRLTSTDAATAQATYTAGQMAYNQQYEAVYNAYLAQHPGDTQGATAAASAAAAVSGTAWTSGAILAARVGPAPPVGTFPVTVDSAASTLDFGFDPGFVRNKPLIYAGPSGTNPGINGLVPGGIYYVRLTDRVNHPGRIQLADAAGNILPISLATGTTTTVLFDELTNGNVSVAASTLTINTPGDPNTPFDPGLEAGDPFAYEGPATPSDPGITGLTPGTIYYVIPTGTPGVIRLAATPQDAQAGNALSISLAPASTNINYGVPFSPRDTRPPVVVPFGDINTSVMSGAAQNLAGSGVVGITISATLSDSESDFASSGTGGSPSLADRLLKPEVTSPTIKDWFSQLWQQPQAPNANNPIANAAPNNAVANLPGGNGNAPPLSVVGTFVVQVSVNTVAADVTGTAVLESASDIAISASVTQTSNTSAQGSITQDQADGKAVALAVAFGYANQTISATIDDGAQVDAAGTISVAAETVYPFVVPLTASAWEGDLVYNPANSTYNPLSSLVNFFTDSMFGLGTDILNNSASAKVSAAGSSSVGVSGTIQLFIAVNHTTARIGNARINQKASDPNALGPGVGITFRNPAQSVSVNATTQYNNASETGAFDFNLAPADFIKNWRSKGISTAFGSVFNLYGDASAGTALGASISIYALDNTTVAEIASGARIGIGSAGTLDVEADQQIIAVSLVQSGDAANGNIGFAGTVNWYNLTSNTRAQIHDGVTVNAGTDAQGHPLPAGAVRVVADDTMYVVGVTGGAVKSEHIGVGFSAAINNIDRTTLALIGSQTTPTQPGQFTVGSLHVGATADGLVANVAYAAASVSQAQGQPPVGANNPLNGVALPNNVVGNNNPLQQQQNGIATSGDASVNILRSDTEAYINDAGAFSVQGGAGALTIDPSLQQATTIHFDQTHELATGDPVVYTAASALGGLTSGTTYYAIRIDPYTIELAASPADASNAQPITLNASAASGTQTLTPTSGAALTFDPSAVGERVLSFAAPHGLATGQAVQYATTGNPGGGLAVGAIYYAIVVDDRRIELADSYADALAGKALVLEVAAGSGTQTLSPVSLTVNAASQTIIVSVAGAYANAAVDPNAGSNLGIAGSLGVNVLDDTTKAYIDGANIAAGQLGVTADHAGYVGSLTAGAAGASGQQGTAVAGSVSVNIVHTDTEAYLNGATADLSGDSNILATEETQIWAIAGAGALGGKGGYDAAIAVNLIGTSSTPARTLAHVTDSTITLRAGTLTVSASEGGSTSLPRIVSLADSLGIGTQQNSYAGAGMVAVNILVDQSQAYLQGSKVLQPTGSPGAAGLVVGASDTSWILAVGGAEGIAKQAGIGAAIGYNQINATTSGYLDSTEIAVNGPVTISANDSAKITGGTLGVGVSTGQGGFAGAGSVSVNIIGNTTDAHVANGSSVTAAGAVTVQAGDRSLIVAVAGEVAGASKAAIGAAVGYSKIANTITATVAGSTIHTTGAPASSALTVAATSAAELIAVVVGGDGASSFALGGSIAINEVANTVEADVVGSTVQAAGDVVIDAGDTTTLIVVAGGLAGARSAAIGAAVGTAQVQNTIKAHIDGSTVASTGGAVGVTAGFKPPETPADRSGVSLGTTTVTLPALSASQIVNVVVAGAGAQTFAGGAAIALNWIKNDVEAYIVGTTDAATGALTRSSVTAAGDVTVSATDSPQIDSAAGGVEGAGEVAVGAAISYNYIGGDPGDPSRRIPPADGPATYTTATTGSVTLQPNDTVDVESGFMGQGQVGSRYQYVGTSSLVVNDLNTVNLDDTTQWQKLSYSDTPGQSLAYIDSSTVTSTAGSVQVWANSEPEIVNVTVGGAGAGTVEVDGSISINFIRSIVHALILNGSAVTGHANLEVEATALPVMIIIAGNGGGAGTFAASVASATNDMRSDIQAVVDDSTVAATTGNLTVHAAVERADSLPDANPATYTADGSTVSVTVQPGDTVDVATGFTGQGKIGSRYKYIGSAPLVVTNFNTVNFTDTTSWQSVAGGPATYTADGSTVSVTVQPNDTVELEAGFTGQGNIGNRYRYIGTTPLPVTNFNTINFTDTTSWQRVASAEPDAQIWAFAVSGTGAGTAALAGSLTLNWIRNTVEARIGDIGNLGTPGGEVQAGGTLSVTARDAATINAIAGALTVAGTASFGASVAYNYLGGDPNSPTDTTNNTVRAAIEGVAGKVRANQIVLDAEFTGEISTITIGGAGAGTFALGGAVAINQIRNTADAHISGSADVATAGAGTPNISLTASDSSTIQALAGGFGFAIGLEGGAGVSIGAGVARNQIANTITAYIDSSQVTSAGGITLAATAAPTIRVLSIGGAAAVAVGGTGVSAAGAGASSTNTITSTVQAYVANGGALTTTNGGNVNLSATDTSEIDAISVGGAIAISGGGDGAGSVAIAASLATNTIGNTVSASSQNSTIKSAGGISLASTSDATINALSVAASVAAAISWDSLSLSGGGASATSTVNNTVSSSIQGTSSSALSTITSAGPVSVTAAETSTFDSKVVTVALSIAIAGGSVGVSVAENTDKSTVSAFIDNATVTTTSGGITISAQSNPTIKETLSVATSVAVAIGANGAGAGATATVTPTVSAYAGSGATLNATGDINVQSTLTSDAEAKTDGVAVGAIALGISVTEVTASGSATAHVDGKITGSRSVTIEAQGTNTANASAFALAGGALASAAGAGATATASPTLQAYTGNNAAITATGAVTVKSTSTPQAIATATGVDVGNYAAVGASVATATHGATVDAYLGDGTHVAAGSLAITAQQGPTDASTPTASARATTGVGAVLVGVNATVAKATSGGEVKAYTGNGVMLPDGDVSVTATNQSWQKSEGLGVSVGLAYGVGANVVESSSAITTSANLGTATGTGTQRTGSLTVTASGVDRNEAASTAGSGGVVAGDASVSKTSDSSTVTAGIGGGTIAAGAVTVSAVHDSQYAPSADSGNGAVLGGSGASATNTGNTTVGVTIGSSTTINAAGAVLISSQNQFHETTSGDSVTAGAGGGLNVAAGLSSSTLTGNANLTLGDAVVIRSGTDPFTNPGEIVLVASSILSATDQVTLTTGGVIEGGGVNSSLNATLGNTLTIGTGAQFTSQGNIGVGTYTIALAQNLSEVSTYGLAGVGAAEATTDVTANQTVTVGDNTTMIAFGDINLTAGNDPRGLFNTTVNGSAIAQGYVRGLIAIPQARATSTLASNATLTIGSGNQISTGQNVNIGAYPGSPNAAADGTGHGYEAGFIPVTNHDSNPSSTTSSSVTQNGTINAGIYHELDITIPDSKNAGPGNQFSSTINVQSGGLPFTSSFNPNFIAPDFIAQHFTGTEAQLLDSNTSSRNAPVGAFTLGPLFAAGGTVTVHGDTISGNGTITAYGGPTISVTNESPDYLVLGPVSIPDAPGGKVLFTGSAGAGDMTIHQIGEDQTPEINITNAYNGPVGDSSFGPALFLTGTVSNLGGLVKITNVSGALGQAATIYGQQVDIDVPNGAVVINITPPGVYYAGGNPYSEWQDYMIWPGGNPAQGVPNANQAIAWVANAEFNADGSITNYTDLTSAIIGVAGNDRPNNQSVVYIGDGVPYVVGVGDDTAGTANALTSLISDGQLMGNYQLGSGTDGHGHFAYIPVQALTKTATSYASANFSGSQNSSAIYGGQVVINAQTLDINGSITAGQPTDWSLDLAASLTLILENYAQQYRQGIVTNPIFNIPVSTILPGDSPITAYYDARTNQITVNNVSATSGGGSVSLKGGMISSNPLGKIHVNGGLGQVTVNNQTGLALIVHDVYAGNSDLIAETTSRVDITDMFQPTEIQQTLYVYQPGKGISIHRGPAGAPLGTGTLASTVMGTSTTYDPLAGLRWQWQEQASLSRQIDSSQDTSLGAALVHDDVDLSDATWSVSNWVWEFPDGQPNNPWQYVNPQGGLSPALDPVGQVIHDLADVGLAFSQTITGTSFGTRNSATTSVQDVHYHGADFGHIGHYGFYMTNQANTEDSYGYTDSSSYGEWDYYYPSLARLTLTTSVKADNPIGISFAGNARGLVSITSNAPVALAGKITNPNGDTTISAQGAITDGPEASITTDNLTLSATAGIGSSTQVLDATLSSGGVLNVQGGEPGVYLNLGSGALIGQVSAGSAQAGFGDVAIVATHDLLPTSGLPTGTVNVTGDNITLQSSLGRIGTAAAPLVISAQGTPLADGSIRGGVVNVAAMSDIGIQQVGGDLLIGSIASGTGDVFIHVTEGMILDALELTAAQGLDPDLTRQIWQNLQLTDVFGAPQNAQRTITAFEGLVKSHYQQYWQLLSNGGVQNGTYTLNAAEVPFYRPQAAAALGVPDPTDAQVRAYAAGLYQSTTAYFTQNIGPDWSTLPDFQTFNPNFQYTATADQKVQLSQNVSWTESQLSFAVDRSALDAAFAIPLGSTTPNVSGAHVTLVAQGGIGRLAPPLSISLANLQSGSLTTEQATALLLATTPGDVLMVGTDAQGHTVVFPFGQTPAGVTLTGIQVAQTAPLFVSATDAVNANAGGAIYLQAADQDLLVGLVQSTGNVNLTAPGSIVSAGTSATQVVAGGNLTLFAETGALGSGPSAPLVLQVGGELISASAGTSASLEQAQGDLRLGRVVVQGNAWIQAAGSILNAGAGATKNLDAANVTLTAVQGSIGTAASDLLVDLTSPSGALTATAATGLYVTEVAGSLSVDRATTSQGDLRLTVLGGDLTLGPGNTIGAATGQVTLQVADDVTIAAGSHLSAGQSVTTVGDFNGTGPGSRIDIDAAIMAPAIKVLGGAAVDTVNLQAVAAGTAMAIDLDGGANVINIGSDQPSGNGVVAGIQGSVAIDGHGADTLNIDDFGNTSAGSATLSDTVFIGLGMNAGGIAYGGLSSLNLQLGTGGVTLDIAGTASGTTTTINAHQNTTNTFNVGTQGPMAGGILDHVQGTLILAGSGGDTLNIDDTGSTTPKNGPLNANTLNGFGMGIGGLTYNGMADLSIHLGSGGNSILIFDTALTTTTFLNSGAGADVVNVQHTAGPTTINTGGGTNTNVVNVGTLMPATGGIIDDIQGALTIVGNGFDTLNLDDTGNTLAKVGPLAGTLTATALTGLGMGPAGITYGGLANLNLNLGSGGNTFLIADTAAPTVTALNSGTGADMVNVRSTSGAMTVNTGGGTNTNLVNVGSLAPGSGGVASGIQGALTIVGNGADMLHIDDTGSTTSQSLTLTDSTLTGLGMGPEGITHGGLARLDIDLGTGNEVINVRGTASGTTTTIDSHAGAPGNIYNVGSLAPMTGGIVDGVRGALILVGNGADSLHLDDTGSMAARSGTLTPTLLTGLGMVASGITYSGMAKLAIDLGSGGNTFLISGTAATTATALNSGTGADTVNVRSTSSPTAVNTGGGTNTNLVNVGSLAPALGGVAAGIQGALTVIGNGFDTMTVDNSGSTTPEDFTLTDTTLTGLGMGPDGITFSGLAGLNLDLGTGGNTLNIRSTPAGTTTRIAPPAGSPNTFNVGSLAPLTGGVLDDIRGPLVLVGGGPDTLNIDDRGSIAPKTGTLTESSLTGLGMAGITYSGMATLAIGLGTGGNTLNVNVSSGANLPSTTRFDLGTATNDALNATWAQDFNGSLVVVGAEMAAIAVGRDFNGSLSDTQPGTIQQMTIGRSLTAPATLIAGGIDILSIGQDLGGSVKVAGTLANLSIGGDLAGSVQESGAIQTVTIGGSVTTTGIISANHAGNPSAGGIGAMTIGPDQPGPGHDLAGRLVLSGTLGDLRVAGGTPGTITAARVGTVRAYGGFGPLVLQINEAGIQRRVEAAVPGSEYPIPPPPPAPTPSTSPAGVSFRYVYEGLASAIQPTNPQWTAQVTNASGNTQPDQFDLSLVTWSGTAKFNLARVDIREPGATGLRNLTVEGDLLDSMSLAATGFISGDPTIPTPYAAGVYMYDDLLAVVGVRDHVHAPGLITSASVQAIAYGSLTAGGVTRTGAASDPSFAAQVLAAGTYPAQAGTTNGQGREVFRVPFGAAPGQAVALFLVDNPSLTLNPNSIAFTDQGANLGDPRGTVTALVTVDGPARTGRSSSVIQGIDLAGDGGSIATNLTIASWITSTGPVGDLTMGSIAGLPANVTAPSIFGSVAATGGPITGVLQTTGLRTEVTTGRQSTIPADFGRALIDGNGTITGVTTIVSTGILCGRIISRGDLISLVNAAGGISGVVAAQGDLGTIQRNPDGTAFLSGSGQLVRFGGIASQGPFTGQTVVLGNVFGDQSSRGQGSQKLFRVAVKGRPVAGLDPTRIGILGGIDIKGTIGAADVGGTIEADSALASAGVIGDASGGTTLNAGAIWGILAARGGISLGHTGHIDPSTFFENAGAPGNPNGAVIDALFSQDGQPLSFDLMGLDLKGLDQILENLASLHVGRDGNLALGRSAPGPLNRPPVVEPIDDRVVDEGTPLSFAVKATDPDGGQALRFELDPGAPAGAHIDPSTGIFSWTPANGPASHTITVRVIDNGTPLLHSTRTFVIAVHNVAPKVNVGPNATILSGEALLRNGSFADPGADNWTATVDYGDGSGTQPLPLNADGTFFLDHVYPNAGIFTVTVSVADQDGAVGTRTFAVQVIGPPTVQSIVINDGSAQRSMIDRLVVTFSGPVVIRPGAFELLYGPRGRAIGLKVTNLLVEGKTVAVLNFTGPGFFRGSLRDGNYTLLIRGSKITDSLGRHLDGDSDGHEGGDRSMRFFRRFGDINGDGRVNRLDFSRFRRAFGTRSGQPRFESAFDFNSNRFVGIGDLFQLLRRVRLRRF